MKALISSNKNRIKHFQFSTKKWTPGTFNVLLRFSEVADKLTRPGGNIIYFMKIHFMLIMGTHGLQKKKMLLKVYKRLSIVTN
jgi:hypothetical protein